MSAHDQMTVRRGTWLYDNVLERSVRILRLNYDYWFDLAQTDGLLDDGEEARLNEHGFLYYVRFGEDGESPFPMSEGFTSCEDAMRWAENRAPCPILWNAQSDG